MNWMFLSSSYVALGNYAEAETFLTEALRISGRNQVGPLFIGAMLSLYQGDDESAVAMLDEAQAIDLQSPGPAIMLADHDLRTGNVGTARERLERLMPELLLVAGARYKNYMQIEIEPFPLVA